MKTPNLKPGDRVVMNDKYYVSEQNKRRVFTVCSETFMCCGKLLVCLEGCTGGYDVAGLDYVGREYGYGQNT